MKNKYFAFLVILMGLFIRIVSADDSVLIKEVTLVEKTDEVVIKKEPTNSGLKIDFNIEFKHVGDYVKYKVLLNNNGHEDYTLSSSDKSTDGYIKYEYIYENNNKVVIAGGEKIVYVVITYAKEIPDDLFKEGKYGEEHNTSITFYNNRLPYEEVNNPKTGTASVLLIIVAVVLSLLISYLLRSRKVRRYLGVLLLVTFLVSPCVVMAINNLFITINTRIIVVKEYKYCKYDNYSFEEFDFQSGDTWLVDSETFFYSKDVIDCYINYYNEYVIKGETDLEKIDICRNMESTGKELVNKGDAIKSKEKGCYSY